MPQAVQGPADQREPPADGLAPPEAWLPWQWRCRIMIASHYHYDCVSQSQIFY